jgi:transcriptional antiterminator NusG
MEAMEFSDQDEQITNSADSSEVEEIESAEASAAPSADSGESSLEEIESAGLEDSQQVESVETDPEESVSEPDSQEEVESESVDSADVDAVEEQTPEIEQHLAAELEVDTPAVEGTPVEDQVQAAAVENAPDAPEDDSVELDLSFLDQDPSDQAESEEDGRSWYVVHCYSGYENKVRHNLEQRIETMGMKNMIFDIVVPTEEEIEVKEGKRRTVERRVFPGYILVNMVMTEESWYVVRNTPGVTGFVGMGNQPTPLRTEEVSQIIKRMEADAPRIKVTFKSGERVRIVDGPFNDFRGTVSEIDMERAKVRVMVNFFGRETPVELDFLQVEKT